MDDTPATISAEVAEMTTKWGMISALLGGTQAMRAAGQTYLPKAPAETPVAYEDRRKVSTLFNGFRRTIETLSAKPFSTPLRLGADVPATIKGYAEDIDLEGRNLQAFAHDVFRTALGFGLSHILVDYPTMAQGQTLADQRTSGVRPYFVHIRPDQVLGWRDERINGVRSLTQLRIMECLREPVGKWATRDVKQVRVLERNAFELYRQNDKGEWGPVGGGPVSLGCIPLTTIYGERTGFMTASPPLEDLGYMNVRHWQSSSDQENILHVARVPILFGSGFAQGSLVLGANAVVTNDDPAATLDYCDSARAAPAIAAGRQSLKDLEELMTLFGARMLIKVPGTRTATESAIDTAEASSALSLMALNMQDALEQALEYAADWDGEEAECSVEVFHNFNDGLDSLSADMLIRAREFGILSAETVFLELQRRRMLADELTWLDETARIKKEGPFVGVSGSFVAPPIEK